MLSTIKKWITCHRLAKTFCILGWLPAEVSRSILPCHQPHACFCRTSSSCARQNNLNSHMCFSFRKERPWTVLMWWIVLHLSKFALRIYFIQIDFFTDKIFHGFQIHLSHQNNGLTFHAEIITKWILWAAKPSLLVQEWFSYTSNYITL